MRGPKSRAGLKAYAIEIDNIKLTWPKVILIEDEIFTCLHSKGRSKAKENKKDHKWEQSLGRSQVVFIGSCNNYQGKDRSTDEFIEES